MERVFSQTFGVVGAIIEKEGKILLVKEVQNFPEGKKGPDHGKWSHPAGWIDVGEDPIMSAKREVEEETGYEFTPKNILGVYSLVRKDIKKDTGTPHGIKIIFTGTISENRKVNLSEDVSEIKWFLPEEIYQMDQETLRDLDIKQMVKDYFAGKKYPLGLIAHTVSE
jgi:ADP-ribose pyrophosphatase YjhB (NUDIX family)